MIYFITAAVIAMVGVFVAFFMVAGGLKSKHS